MGPTAAARAAGGGFAVERPRLGLWLWLPCLLAAFANASRPRRGDQQLKWNAKETWLQKAMERSTVESVACFILCILIFGCTVMYLLKHKDPQIQSYSHKSISRCVVVCLALGVMNAIHALIHDVVDTFPSSITVVDYTMVTVFVIWFSSLRWSSSALRRDPESRYARLNANVYIAAFILLESMGEWQEHAVRTLAADSEGVRHNSKDGMMDASRRQTQKSYNILVWLVYAVTPLLVFVIIQLMSTSMTLLFTSGAVESAYAPAVERNGSGGKSSFPSPPARVYHRRRTHYHGDAAWENDADNAETGVSAIVVGYLLKQMLVFATSSHSVAPMECGEFTIECRPSFKQVVLLLAAVATLHMFKIAVAFSGWISVWSSKLQLHASMISVWVVVQVVQMCVTYLTFDTVSDEPASDYTMVKKLMTASFLSALFVLTIFSTDKQADRGLLSGVTAEECVASLALMTGLFLEQVADNAIKHVGKDMPVNCVTGFFARLMLLVPLAVAWRLYIVPTASLPVSARMVKAKEGANKISTESAMGVLGGMLVRKDFETESTSCGASDIATSTVDLQSADGGTKRASTDGGPVPLPTDDLPEASPSKGGDAAAGAAPLAAADPSAAEDPSAADVADVPS